VPAKTRPEPNAEEPAPADQRPSGGGLSGSALVGIRRLTAIDTVRARIAMAVDLRLLSPGERLPPPSQIAEAMDVSEITVRRALTSLARDGVLERRRGRGGGTLVAAEPTLAAVAETDAYRGAATEVHDLIDRRMLLEVGVTHLAALSVTRARLAGLRRLVREMDRAGTWAQFHTADEQFHLAVAEATGLPGAAAQYRLVLRDLYRYYLPYPVDYLRESNCEHRELVDALAGRDVVRAVEVARRHVATLHDSMFVGLASG
jgi:DNA-binding FadR family transcriptional regulator